MLNQAGVAYGLVKATQIEKESIIRCSDTLWVHSYSLRGRTATSRHEKPGPQESHQALAAKPFCHCSSNGQRSFIHALSSRCIKAIGLSISLFFGRRTTNETAH